MKRASTDYNMKQIRKNGYSQDVRDEALRIQTRNILPESLDIETILQLCQPPCLELLTELSQCSENDIRRMVYRPTTTVSHHGRQERPYLTPTSVDTTFNHNEASKTDASHSRKTSNASMHSVPASFSPDYQDLGTLWPLSSGTDSFYGCPRVSLPHAVNQSVASSSLTPPNAHHNYGNIYSNQASVPMSHSGSNSYYSMAPDVEPSLSYDSQLHSSGFSNELSTMYTQRTHQRNHTAVVPLSAPRSYPQTLPQSEGELTNPEERPNYISFDPVHTHRPSRHKKRLMPCPELNCSKSYSSPPELREHCIDKHERTEMLSCKHSNCDLKTYRDSSWKHHHTADHKNCPYKEQPADECRERMPIWTKRTWGCSVCGESAFHNILVWITHYANHFQFENRKKSDRSFTNLISSLLSQSATQPFWRAKQADASVRFTWVETNKECEELRRSLEEGEYRGHPIIEPKIAAYVVGWAVKIADKETEQETRPDLSYTLKRQASSSLSPSGSSGYHGSRSNSYDARSRQSHSIPRHSTLSYDQS